LAVVNILEAAADLEGAVSSEANHNDVRIGPRAAGDGGDAGGAEGPAKGKSYIGFRSSGHQFISAKADTGLWVGGPIDIDGNCGITSPAESDGWMPPYTQVLKTSAEPRVWVRENAGAGKLR
jgi:hypothetical protein